MILSHKSHHIIASTLISLSLHNISYRHKIQLCQALLLLRINSMERLREKLAQLPDEFLTRWLKRNLGFAIDVEAVRLTEFGKVHVLVI